MIPMLIFRKDKIVCHLGTNRIIDREEVVPGRGPGTHYRNYAIHFTVQVNGSLKDIRTVLGQEENGEYVQDNFTSVVNVLSDIGYTMTPEELGDIYQVVQYDLSEHHE